MSKQVVSHYMYTLVHATRAATTGFHTTGLILFADRNRIRGLNLADSLMKKSSVFSYFCHCEICPLVSAEQSGAHWSVMPASTAVVLRPLGDVSEDR